MIMNTLEIDLSVAGKKYGPIDITLVDDLYYRFERGAGLGALSGTLSIGYGLTLDDEPHDSAALTLDQTQQAVAVDQFAYAWFTVGIAQAGYGGVLHLYGRVRPIQTA